VNALQTTLTIFLQYLILVMMFFVPVFRQAQADSSSTNYSLVEERFTGGGGNISSANYQSAETSFEPFASASPTSTNYGFETKAGIGGALNIVAINSIAPSNFYKYYSDQTASFTVTAVDPDSDSLQYRAKQDATVKDGPQASNVLDWTLSASDLGRHTLSFEVIDPDGTVLKQQYAYVVRRPVK
jgi:hypothetical protein